MFRPRLPVYELDASWQGKYSGGDEKHGLLRPVEEVYLWLSVIHRRASLQNIHSDFPPSQLFSNVAQRGDGVEEDEDAFSLGNGFRNDIDCHDDLVGMHRKSEVLLVVPIKDILRPL
jgi:hypothetical protein